MDNKKPLFSRSDLIKISLPLIIQQILAVTIGMVDTMMVARAGEAAVSGVSLVNSLDTLLVIAFSALVTGGSVVVAQLLGKNNREGALDASKQLVYSAVAVAVAITVFGLLFRDFLLGLLFGEVEPDVMMNAQSYFVFVAFSFPFLAINNAGGALYRVMGNSTMSMLISVMMNIINVCGNAVLINVFGLGAAGAAISTLVSRMIGTIVTLYLLRNRKNTVYVDRYLDYRPDFKVIKEILRIGVPNGIENSMFHFGKLLTQSLISSMGTAAIAANAVAATLANYQYMPGGALSSAIITVVGRCIGAGEKEQAKKYTRILIGATYACLWVVIAVTFFIAKPVIGIYELSAEGAEIAYQLIIYHAILAAALHPIAFTLAGSFRAASDVKYPLVISMISMWTFRVGLSFYFSLDVVSVFGLFSFAGLGLGPLGVWMAMTVDWVFRAILFSRRYLSGKWLEVYGKIKKKA